MIDLCSNRSKGINGYIAPVSSYSGEIHNDRAMYPIPKPGQEQASYKGKFFKGEVDESKLPDGWYYWKEAVFQSTKSDSGLIEIKRGEIVREAGTIAQLKIITCNEFFPDLPPLIGTPKQTAYAESLRAAYLLQMWEIGLINFGDSPSAIALKKSPNEAKWWIEAGSYAPARDWVNAALSLQEAIK